MGKPLKVVVVGDSHAVVLKVAEDFDKCGYEPAVFLAPDEAELERIAPDCEFVVAWSDATAVPPGRVLELAASRGGFPPVFICADSYTEEEIVTLVRAGARDCLRRGDLARVRAAVERERAAKASARAGGRTDAETVDRYRSLIEEIPALTYVAWADETGSRAYVSPQLQVMTGFSPSEWLAEPNMWVRRLHPEDREPVLQKFHDACAAGGRFAAEYRVLDREGRVVWWRDEGRVLLGPDGKARFVRGFVLDVTEQRLAEESLRKMRFYDQLTGLPNRVLLLNRLGRELAEAVRTSRPLALLILALDRFREITNTLGHHNGDIIVRDLAGRLGDALGDADRVARLRGDEFGFLLPDADASFARQVGDRILGSLDRPFIVQKLPIEVSASIGMAVAPEHGTEAETLLRRADSAVQEARRLGGGTSVVYSSACEPHDPAKLALQGELRRALDGNELLLHYQPKVDLKTRTVVGAEALLRWPHAKRGFVPPLDFIPDAERTGLIRPLTRWVLDRAVGEAKGWLREGRSLPVAVNVSARSLRDGRVVEDVEQALRTHDLRPDRLQIEVTEHAVMDDAARAAEVLSRLTSKGVSVSIDDFGIGSSSLAHLRKLRVHELKIDKSFVMGMAGDEGGEDTAIVRSTADLAHNLGLVVVAEGVEDQWTLDLLPTLGCDEAQGYHIARPMPSADFMGWLGSGAWKVGES
jgi:diguanylate cyclase (GGDEF)-like protein/PAS domain S-box-containing protein